MIKQKKTKVAVMAFPTLDGRITKLGVYLSDKLTNSLFKYQNKFYVVDRMHLEQVLAEMKLGLTGLQDPKTIQKLGRILGADAIVIGTLTDIGPEIDITTRVLGTEKANVIAVANVVMQKDKNITNLLKYVGLKNVVFGYKREKPKNISSLSTLNPRYWDGNLRDISHQTALRVGQSIVARWDEMVTIQSITFYVGMNDYEKMACTILYLTDNGWKKIGTYFSIGQGTQIKFKEPITTDALKIKMVSGGGGDNYISISEIQILGWD